MDMVALAESESDGKAGVDADGSACADVKVASTEAPCDGSGLLVGELAGTLCWTEGGGGGTGEGCGVVVVLLLLESGVDGRRRKVNWIWLLLGSIGVRIRTRRSQPPFQAALAGEHLAAPSLAGVARHTRSPDRRPLGCFPSAVRFPVNTLSLSAHLSAAPPQLQPPPHGPVPAAAVAVSPASPVHLAPLRRQEAQTSYGETAGKPSSRRSQPTCGLRNPGYPPPRSPALLSPSNGRPLFVRRDRPSPRLSRQLLAR